VIHTCGPDVHRSSIAGVFDDLGFKARSVDKAKKTLLSYQSKGRTTPGRGLG